MFEDHKVRERSNKLNFQAIHLLDCTHGVNNYLSRKENASKKTIEGKVTKIYC